METPVYITGYSGRFPGCSSVAHFWEHICKGIDSSSQKDTRAPLPQVLHDVTKEVKNDVILLRSNVQAMQESAALHVEDRYMMEAIDNTLPAPLNFLGHNLDQKDPSLDLLELVFETLTDAGYCQQDLHGSDTGVYLSIPSRMGCSFAERTADVFGLRGAAVVMQAVDSTSSLAALDVALRAIRSGAVSRAVVVAGDGECTGAVLLESHHVAPQGGVLQLLGSGVTTGEGTEALVQLCEAVCGQSAVDPREVVYVEAHHDFFRAAQERSEGRGTARAQSRCLDELSALDQVYGRMESTAPVSSPPPSHLAEERSRRPSRDASSESSRAERGEEEAAAATMHLRQEKVFVFSSKATTISSGASWTLPLPVTAPSASIRYQFSSRDGDMIFAMYYVTATKKQVLVPQRLFDFAQDATAGHCEVRGPGTLHLRWANTHSWLGEKSLSYSVEIKEVEHPTLENPQKRRVEESMRTLAAIRPAVHSQQASLEKLDSYISTFRASDMSALQEECARTQGRKSTMLCTTLALRALQRRAWSSAQDMAQRRLALGLRILNSYQLAEVLSYLAPLSTHLVCRYWRDVGAWDERRGLPPSSDYSSSPASAHSSVGVDDELDCIIAGYLESEVSTWAPPSRFRPSSTMAVARGNEGGALVGSLGSCGAGSRQPASWTAGLMSLIKVLAMVSEQAVPVTFSSSSGARGCRGDPALVRPFLAGRLRVPVSASSPPQPLRLTPCAVVAINSMSEGGSNAHVLCCSGGLAGAVGGTITRYVCGRSKLALENYLQTGRLDASAWQKHLRQSANTDTFPWRGVVHNDSKGVPATATMVDVHLLSSEKKRVAFCFAGHGIEWQQLALALWRSSPRFREVLVEGCAGLPIDLENLFSKPNLKWVQLQMPDFGITLLQIGLTVLLRDVGVQADVMVGHGIGEIACSFADGCTSAADAFSIAFHRSQLGQSLEVGGLMLDVGLDLHSGQEFIKAYPNCTIACHNSPAEVTISGQADEIKQIEESLQAVGVSTSLLNTGEVSYHSLRHTMHVAAIKTLMKEATADMTPKLRSSKWISTSCNACTKSIPHHCYYPTVNYEVNNICNVVDFASVLPALSSNMFVLEIGSAKMLEIFTNAEIGGTCSGRNMEYRSVDGSAVAMRALADQLWLEGVPLDFERKPCLVSVRDRLAINWDRPRGAQATPPPASRTTTRGSTSKVSNKSINASVPRRRRRALVTMKVQGVEMPSPGALGSPAHVSLRQRATSPASSQGFSVHMTEAAAKGGGTSSWMLQWTENSCSPDCEVKYCALNPIDVEASTDYDEDEDEDEDVEEASRGLGWEFSGVRDDGVAVMGVISTGALATHVSCSSPGALLWRVPTFFSLQEAATLPLDYCTAYLALVVQTGIRAGQMVLIEDICSGVGQAVLQICRHRNCSYVAVCPADKKEWAHEHLGVELDWLLEGPVDGAVREAVLERTQGEGVDVLVHSSGLEMRPEEMQLVRKFGHFCMVERSQRRSQAPRWPWVHELSAENSVSIHFVNIFAVVTSSPTLRMRLQECVEAGLKSGEVVPKKFSVHTEVEAALSALRSDGEASLGLKTLVRVNGETRLHSGGGGGEQEKVTRLLQTRGTHLVVGGRNKNNFDVAHYLLRRGAERVIVARHSTPGEEVDIGATSADPRVSSMTCDLTLPAACRNLVHASGPELVGLWLPGRAETGAEAEAEAEVRVLKDLEQASRAVAGVEHFVVWRACLSLGLALAGEGKVRDGYKWDVEAVCAQRRAEQLPAVLIQIEQQVDVAPSLSHLDDIVHCDNTIVAVWAAMV